MSNPFEIPVGDPQENVIYTCDCGNEGEYCSDNNASGHAEWYCAECENNRSFKYGCAMFVAEGCGCVPGGRECACGCEGTGRL